MLERTLRIRFFIYRAAINIREGQEPEVPAPPAFMDCIAIHVERVQGNHFPAGVWGKAPT